MHRSKKNLVVVGVAVVLAACGGGGILVDRAAAIDACAAAASLNDDVPNPRARKEGYYYFPFLAPTEVDLKNRIAVARSRAASSRDRELQRLTDALRVTSADGRSLVAVGQVVEYCNRQGY